MTPARLATIDELAPIWMLPSDRPLTPDHLDTSFGRRAPHLLDIGIGNGDATRAWALAHPEVDVVGVELHRPGIAHLLRHLDADGPPNVRVVDGPFLNFSGVVEEVMPQKQKVRVLVSIFGRATPVELDFMQIERM